MKNRLSRSCVQILILILAVLVLTKPSNATTAILLSDEQLITSSRVILLGDVVSIKSQWDLNHDNINSFVKVRVSKVLKGQLQSDHIVFKQLGGTVGDNSTVIFGAPQYKAGQRVLLFLDTAQDGTLRIAHLFQGKYDVYDNPDTGQTRVERRLEDAGVNILGVADGPTITNSASLAKFSKKIRKVLSANAAEVGEYDAKYSTVPIVEIPLEYIDDAPAEPGDVKAQYTFLGSFRWFEPDSGQPVIYRVNPTTPPIAGGGITEINQALAAWTNVQTTALVLQNGGSTTQFGFRQDGVTAISYNDPLDQMSDPVGCSGTLAIGGVSSAGGGSIVIGGRSFSHIFEGDVVFNRNFQCFLGISANLAEVACHEIGHSIGFDHSADSAAIMWASAHGQGRGATLGADDIAAVSFLYPGSKGGPVAPLAPASLAATAVSQSAINLTWLDRSNNEDGFRLERRTGTTGSFALIATLPAGQVGYSDSGLQSSTTYFYRVKAFNGGGESAYSNEASAATPATQTNNASFVSQSVPSSIIRGQIANASVTMSNSGTSTWTAGTYYLGSQNPQSNTTWGLNRVNLTSTVSPGGQATFTFNITAPSSPGTYNFRWQMAGDGAGFFGSMSTNLSIVVSNPSATKRPFDFDGDGKADITVYRPTNGYWYVINSSTGQVQIQPWGLPGDVAVPGDYDGDGRTDTAVYRPANGNWYIINSSTGQARIQQWGLVGDAPVPGDYDGDGKTDLAVFRPSDGNWFIINSATGQVKIQQWALSGDKPVPADYDGDGKADITIYRPSNGYWFVINSSNGQVRVVPWGLPGDMAVPADYDGDGRTDMAVFRPAGGNWYIINSSTGQVKIQQWALSGDKPVAADYDGDGKADIAVYRPSDGNWFIIKSTDSQVTIRQWGLAGDLPVPLSAVQ